MALSIGLYIGGSVFLHTVASNVWVNEFGVPWVNEFGIEWTDS